MSTVKKRPGRPRKNPKRNPEPRNGIASTPQNQDHVLEMFYSIPLIFKKIIAFFKSLASLELQIIFRHEEVIFYATDHLKKSEVRIKIDAHKLHHYYCKREFHIGLNCHDLELIFNKVDKDYVNLKFISDVSSQQKTLMIMLDNHININETHTVRLIGNYKRMSNEDEFLDTDYMIKFMYPSKYFKKTISDIKTMSSRLCIIQESSEDPLEIEYRSDNKKVQSRHIAKSSSKIKLESHLDPDDSFRVDIVVDYIKPISNAQIADDVYILVDENKKLMTCSYIDDGTIEIKTLTQIIDNRTAV